MPATSQQQRAISALLVLLLHALLLLALLQFLVKPQGADISHPERLLELMISMPRVAPPPPPSAAPRRQRAPIKVQPGGERSGAMPSQAPPVLTPDIRGLGQALLGCAPENLSNLTVEQRAHCPGLSRPDDSALIESPSHVKDPVRRAAEMRARNKLLRIPCTSITQAQIGGGTATVPMTDPFCVLEGAIRGFGPLNGLSK
jgi:hypothetical protein